MNDASALFMDSNVWSPGNSWSPVGPQPSVLNKEVTVYVTFTKRSLTNLSFKVRFVISGTFDSRSSLESRLCPPKLWSSINGMVAFVFEIIWIDKYKNTLIIIISKIITAPKESSKESLKAMNIEISSMNAKIKCYSGLSRPSAVDTNDRLTKHNNNQLK